MHHANISLKSAEHDEARVNLQNTSTPPARPVTAEPLEALPTQAPGADSMDSVSGVGIGLEVTTVMPQVSS